jgi:DNA (cytosine-5)-methyltransferase 1
MTHGSLFSGIGGFDLAAEWMGWDNKFHCEWNEFGQKVLNYYFPNSELFTDITKSDFTKYANQIDILTGGFPCQPYSTAGKRLGKEDDRHLWPEMLRAIKEIKPRWVVGENVLGLVNWNGGLVFHEVQTDLEAEGYEVFPYVLPAASVNAPHRRDRVWFVAYSGNNRNSGASREIQTKTIEKDTRRKEQSTTSEQQIQLSNESNFIFGNASDTKSSRSTISKLEEPKSKQQLQTWSDINRYDDLGNVTDSNKIRFSTKMENGELGRKQRFIFSYKREVWDSFPSVSPICNGDDGLSNRLDSITFSKWRNESIKAGGNAIVPQVVYQIFKAIKEYEALK